MEEAKQKYSFVEFLGWNEFFANNDHEERSDFRNGQLMSLLANINRGEDSETFIPANFMPCSPQYVEVSRAMDVTTVEGFTNKMNAFFFGVQLTHDINEKKKPNG